MIITRKKNKLIWHMLRLIWISLKFFIIPMILALYGATASALLLNRIPSYYWTIENFRLSAMLHDLSYGEHNRMLFLAFLGIIGLIYLMISFSMTSKSDNFQSKMVDITSQIRTPAAVGQAQYGSAKWINEQQLKKAFGLYIIDSKENKIIASLIKDGMAIKANLTPKARSKDRDRG